MIELGTEKDLKKIMEILEETKEEFRTDHNPQWGSTEEDYPNQEKILDDIRKNSLYLIKDNNLIKGFITIAKDNGEYEELVKTSHLPAYILHRMTIPKVYRRQGIAQELMHFAEELAIKNDIRLLKADTEKRNDKMNHLFLKLGYEMKGSFIYDDYPGEYIYYEKQLGSEEK